MLLALETSTSQGSLYLADLKTPEIAVVEEKWEGGSRGLFSMLEKHSHFLKQVALCAIGLGPGNFSGIRISLAVAKALRVTRKVTLLGVPSVHAIGHQLSHITRLGVFGDAKRNEYYYTLFEKGKSLGPTRTLARNYVEQEIEKVTLAVSSEILPEISERAWPEAKTIAYLAWEKWKSCSLGDLVLEPIYLREPIKNSIFPR